VKLLTYEKLAQCETLVMGVFSDVREVPVGLPKSMEGLIARVREIGDVTGKADEVHVLYPEEKGSCRLILCGLGEMKKWSLPNVRKALGLGAKRAQALKSKEVAVWLETFAGESGNLAEVAQAAAMVGLLALYQYQELKTFLKPEDKTTAPKLFLASRNPEACAKAVDWGEIIAEAANYARTLANRPGNKVYPQILANEARLLARQYSNLAVSVLTQPQLGKAGFGALTAVGSGSSHSPVLIEIKYHGDKPKAAPIALVGKGITFDSGGICLKPSAKMEDMKFDMCGAAAVLGIFKAVAKLKLPINLVGIIPAAENLPSGTACRPGDVVTSLSGQTIEILNTDAEGRLILADALTYALRHKPSQILDMATLTGAVVVALGHAAIGMAGNDDTLAAEIHAAGEESGERVWRMPLWDEYRDLLKSDVADLANIGSKPGAGTIVGAAFLEKFVGQTPWVHLDIAGTAYGDGGSVYAKGATGVGVRLVVEWLRKKLAFSSL
jgi:leucyl aminopeptidase